MTADATLTVDDALDVIERHVAYVDHIDAAEGVLLLLDDEVLLATPDEIAEFGAALLVIAAWKRQQAAA